MPPPSAVRKPKPGPSKPSRDLPSCSTAASKLLFDITPVELIDLIASQLQQTVDANKALLGGHKQSRSAITRFHTRDPPAITVKAYLTRLLQLAPFPFDALLLAVVYINRLTHLQAARSPQSEPRFQPLFKQQRPSSVAFTLQEDDPVCPRHKSPSPPLTPWTVHRLLLGTLAIAAKYSSDAYIGQRRLAKVGGISPKELSELEVEVFDQLSWSCYTHASELDGICSQLWRLVDRAQRCDGGEEADTQDTGTHEVLRSPDSLKIGSLSLSPIPNSRSSPSPTPVMSEGDSESSGFASSLDDSITKEKEGGFTAGKHFQNQNIIYDPPALMPLPIR